ncbi:hypothetical protein DWX43_16040 [Clostridium sp. AF19-22AC]|jgi:hypothetical protein|uniref:hypothetical protein n=1 Tax=Clostridia TaxID=186801 RepID=UPI000E50CABD|nr:MULTISPECIES: hypothetical protein [Clostridia]RHR26201.1 hypothetical protein DWX43_16040 [Clostridium sp. AF19-22AC]
MAEVSKVGSEYVGYEYKRKEILKEHASLYLDSYPCFGWEEDPNTGIAQERTQPGGYVTLNFRRDRKICNKVELTRLQRNFDGCILEIDRLEKSKATLATIAAMVIGVTGTACMAGSVFAVTVDPPLITLCIILAIPGFAGWIAPWFVYRVLIRKRSAKIQPLIEDEMEELYEVCRKGKDLLI